MKPKEFDELVRQKFDQNDFEYNPGNWSRLEEQLDGRAKKRSMMIWWWVPLAGIAASVALAMGVPALLRQQGADNTGANTELAQRNNIAQPIPQQEQPAPEKTVAYGTAAHSAKTTAKRKSHTTAKQNQNTGDKVGLQYHDIADNHTVAHSKPFDFMTPGAAMPTKADDKKDVAVNDPGYHTFKPSDEIKKPARTSIIISGGINRGSLNSGYMAGATIRRMLNDKVYIEGDVAYANSDNTQAIATQVTVPGVASRLANHGSAAKSSDESGKAAIAADPTTITKEENVSYDLSYAQVTPCIGYQLMKRMSLAVGPDFQQMLADNRPVQSATLDRNNIQEAPSFDVGFIGKSEFAITKKVKAAVYYRKGINSLISLTDKYIDRDYIQFQVKCTIFNK